MTFVFVASAKTRCAIRSVCTSLSLSFCLSMICQQHYCRRTEPISLKLVVMIRHISRKNLTTFGGNPVRETVFGSLSHISHHCVIRRFISIVHSHRPIFTTLGEMTDGGKIMNPQHFGSDPDTNQD